MASEKQVEHVVEKVAESLGEVVRLLGSIRDKVSCIELRQSRASSEVTDAIRAAHSWAEAESASWHETCIQGVATMFVEEKRVTYWHAFIQKDLRRAQYELWKLWKYVAKKDKLLACNCLLTNGDCLTMLPSARKELAKKLDLQANPLPQLPLELEKLFVLEMPMNQQYEPRTYKQLKKERLLPEDDDVYVDLDEEKAVQVWAWTRMGFEPNARCAS